MVFHLFFSIIFQNDLNLNSLTCKKWWRSSRLLVWERFIIGRRKGEIIISTLFKTQIRHDSSLLLPEMQMKTPGRSTSPLPSNRSQDD